MRELIKKSNASIYKIDSETVSKEDDNEYIIEEFNILRDLNHPNIIKAKGSSKGILYLPFYKYDLYDYIKEGNRLSKLEYSTIMLKIADALKHIHKRGYIHKDIKPGNIVFNSPLEPILIDFGLTEGITADKSIMSTTVGYMAPEMLLTNKYTEKVDIFALGCLYYFLITGKDLMRIDGDQGIYLLQLNVISSIIPCRNYRLTDCIILNNELTGVKGAENFSKDECDILQSLLCVNDSERIEINDVIEYFDNVIKDLNGNL